MKDLSEITFVSIHQSVAKMIMCWQPVRIEQNAHAPGKIKMPYGRSAKGANTKYIISQTHTHKNCSTMHFKHFSTPTWSTLERAADQLMRGAEKNLVDICVCEQWGSKTERVLKVRIIEAPSDFSSSS